MKNLFKKFKSFFMLKKKQPWYIRWYRKTTLIMDFKRRNKFIIFFGLLFLALYISFPSLENIAKQLVHEYGSKIIGTSVSIKGLNFKPTSGYASVTDFEIENPKGYKSKNLFYLKELSVQIDLSTITDELIIVDNVKINNPQITYEMLSLKQNNISDILNNIKNNTVSDNDAKDTSSSKKTNNKSSSKKVVIKTLSVNDGAINVMMGIGKFKKELSLPLPKIEMHNIGQDKKGATIKDTISTVITKILNSATQTVVSQNLNNLKEVADNELKNLTSNLKDGAIASKENVKDSIKNLIKLK